MARPISPVIMAAMSALLFRLRWVILGLGCLGLGAGIAWVTLMVEGSAGLLGTPLLLVGAMTDDVFYYANVAVFLMFFAVSQFLFLWPVRRLPIALATTGRPMWLSLTIGGFIAMLVTTGLIATVLQLFQVWESVAEPLWPVGMWIAMLISWAIWGGLFALMCRRGDRYRRLRRMLRLLIAGSLLDLLIATPVHAVAARQESCYCGLGSYTGLVLGATALLWTFGPGVTLLIVRQHYLHARMLRQREAATDSGNID